MVVNNCLYYIYDDQTTETSILCTVHQEEFIMQILYYNKQSNFNAKAIHTLEFIFLQEIDQDYLWPVVHQCRYLTQLRQNGCNVTCKICLQNFWVLRALIHICASKLLWYSKAPSQQLLLSKCIRKRNQCHEKQLFKVLLTKGNHVQCKYQLIGFLGGSCMHYMVKYTLCYCLSKNLRCSQFLTIIYIQCSRSGFSKLLILVAKQFWYIQLQAAGEECTVLKIAAQSQP